MRAPTITIAGIMWVSFVVCLSLAALRNASETWAGVVWLVTTGVLLCAIVAAVCRPAAERPWWLGFALFGWGYLQKVFPFPWSPIAPVLPTDRILTATLPLLHARDGGGLVPSQIAIAHWQIGHCLSALIVATLGGLAALALCHRTRHRTEAPIAEPQGPAVVSARWWRRPVVIAFGGLSLFIIVALVGYPRHDAMLVGTAYLATASLVGTAILGALLAVGPHRVEWLGAALFGGCFLGFQLTSAWPDDETRPPYLAANRLLGAARPWFVAGVRFWHGDAFAGDTKDEQIREKLAMPIAMEFAQDTPLDEVLLYVRAATEGPNGDGIPIYVDPGALDQLGITTRSPVRIHLIGVPLETTLSLVLDQVGLTYDVRNGLLTITSPQTCGQRIRELDDPYLLIGYCALTCFATGMGGVLALGVARIR